MAFHSQPFREYKIGIIRGSEEKYGYSYSIAFSGFRTTPRRTDADDASTLVTLKDERAQLRIYTLQSFGGRVLCEAQLNLIKTLDLDCILIAVDSSDDCIRRLTQLEYLHSNIAIITPDKSVKYENGAVIALSGDLFQDSMKFTRTTLFSALRDQLVGKGTVVEPKPPASAAAVGDKSSTEGSGHWRDNASL